MFKVLKNSWALFTGLGFMMIAHGLQGNLLGVRATYENFNLIEIGAIMSGYYMGYLTGAHKVTDIVYKVGHIRVFAALASLASLIILLHSLFVNPYTWFCSRLITGFCIAGIHIIVEGWLNDRANNRTRGQLLSVYMMIIYIGMGIGMLVLSVTDPKAYEPFIIISLLMSLALIPILLTKRKAPTFRKIKSISIQKLYQISPCGTVTSFLFGLANSSLSTLLAVYCASKNFTLLEISFTTCLLTFSGAIAQWPIGFISDRVDRRKVIVGVAFGATIAAYFLFKYTDTVSDLNSSKFLFYSLIFIYSFLFLPTYSLYLSHTNDLIEKDNIVSAGAGLNFIYGIGAIMGPIICAGFMNFYGTDGFFIFLIIIHVATMVYGINRIFFKERSGSDSSFVSVPKAASPFALELSPEADPMPTERKENV